MEKDDYKDLHTGDRMGIANRIAATVSLLGTRIHAAAVAGISRDQLARYVNGTSQPAFIPIARLADEAGVSLDWIWSGKGPMRLANRVPAPKIDKSELGRCIQLLEATLEDEGLTLSTEKKAAIIVLLCELVADNPQICSKSLLHELLNLTR